MQSFWLLRLFWPSVSLLSFALPNMQPQRPTFCGFYQLARQVQGRPQCSFTRQSCPHGLHACQLCGKSGHGAEDCRTRAQPPTTPPAEQPPPPPTMQPPPQPTPEPPPPSMQRCGEEMDATLSTGLEPDPRPFACQGYPTNGDDAGQGSFGEC